jgi:hypothetical protein
MELFPVFAGVILGLVTDRFAPRPLGALRLCMLGLAFGAVASWTSGELMISGAYLFMDAAQVLAVALVLRVLAAAWRRHYWIPGRSRLAAR